MTALVATTLQAFQRLAFAVTGTGLTGSGGCHNQAQNTAQEDTPLAVVCDSDEVCSCLLVNHIVYKHVKDRCLHCAHQ